MSVLNHANFFHGSAAHDLATATDRAGTQVGLLFYAHASATDWTTSITYPIRHLINAATNALKIVMGCGLLLAAFFYYPLESVPEVTTGLGYEISALGLNILNIAFSTISIATRTIASIVALPAIDEQMRNNLIRYDAELEVGMVDSPFSM